MLNIVDAFNLQALRIEADTSLKAARVVSVLKLLKETRGVPAMIMMDNGPELVSILLNLWYRENCATLALTHPSKSTLDAIIEGFNRSQRTEVLNAYVFRTNRDVFEHVETFLLD